MQRIFYWASLICFVCLSGCASYDFSRHIVQQGNLISQKTVERLKIGMSKEDAAILMGTSLLSPTFNNDRWDYVYTRRKGANSNTIRHISLYFSGDRLSKLDQS